MSYRRWIICAAVLMAGAAFLRLPIFAQTVERKTVWDGVYTVEQADRGSVAYLANCSPCHGTELEGVANLKGNDFMERWREFDVRGLYDWISKSMPRTRRGSDNRPGSLTEKEYVDIIAHIFRGNDFPPAKDELSVSLMKTIQIERKFGPLPVPDGAIVQMVGCLTKRNTSWYLTNSSEPKRTALSDTSTEEELKDAHAKALGNQQFALSNFGYIGADFDPNTHVNERMQTKGVLTRQPVGGSRISITSMVTLAPTCP